MTKQRDNRSGVIILVLCMTFPVLLLLGGLAMDMVYIYIVDNHLAASVDSAVLAAARTDSGSAASMANSVFNGNFPAGYMMSLSSSLNNLSISSSEVSALGTATVPTFLMRVTGQESVTLNHLARVAIGSGGSAGFLLIDEDTIDNGTPGIEDISFNWPDCGGGDPSVCVNDDIADPYVRTPLFTRGNDVTGSVEGLVLPTGQLGDEGLFKLTNADPQVSAQTPLATFTTQELFDSTGNAADENNLDKIIGARALTEQEIKDLVGYQVCGLVFDSDISDDPSSGWASLKGATQGVTAFEVTGWQPSPAGGSYLPEIIVRAVNSVDIPSVCSSLSGGSGSSSATYMYLTQ